MKNYPFTPLVWQPWILEGLSEEENSPTTIPRPRKQGKHIWLVRQASCLFHVFKPLRDTYAPHYFARNERESSHCLERLSACYEPFTLSTSNENEIVQVTFITFISYNAIITLCVYWETLRGNKWKGVNGGCDSGGDGEILIVHTTTCTWIVVMDVGVSGVCWVWLSLLPTW